MSKLPCSKETHVKIALFEGDKMSSRIRFSNFNPKLQTNQHQTENVFQCEDCVKQRQKCEVN